MVLSAAPIEPGHETQPTPQQTSAQIIVAEIRHQVDLQVSAADAMDSKAMAVFAGAAAVAAFITPRVAVADPRQTAAAVVTLGALVGALICLLQAVRPRIGGHSNGPDVGQLALYIDSPAEDLVRELVPAYVAVRNRNEAFLKSKADWMIHALWCLFGAVVGMAFMGGVGAIK